MKNYWILITVFSLWVLLMTACAHKPSPEEIRLDKAAQALIETDERLMKSCLYLGSVSVTGDANPMFAGRALRKTKDQVKRQAVVLEATHIVWLYTYDTTAAALAYRCPE